MTSELEQISLTGFFGRIFGDNQIPAAFFPDVEYCQDEMPGTMHVFGRISGPQPRRITYILRALAEFAQNQKSAYLARFEQQRIVKGVKRKPIPKQVYKDLNNYIKSEERCLGIIDRIFWESVYAEFPKAAYDLANPKIYYDWHLAFENEFDEELPFMFKPGHFLNNYFHCLEEIFTGKSRLSFPSDDRLPDVEKGETVMGSVKNALVIKQLNSLALGLEQIRLDYWPEKVERTYQGLKAWKRQQTVPQWELFDSRDKRLKDLFDLTYDLIHRLTVEYLEYPPEALIKFCRGWDVVCTGSTVEEKEEVLK